MKSRIILKLISITLLFSVVSCSNPKGQNKKTLLIYCGITMIKPMTEIEAIIEKQEDCEIEITKGGSGNLLKALEQSGIGDLYLPGSDSYIHSAIKKGLIEDTACVGHNKLAMLVQEGNPLNIQADLKSLTSTDYYVIIGNPNSGSVGKMTKKILQAEGIFDEVEQNVIRFTTDSKDLSLALVNKEADLVVNWYATSTWESNVEFIDALDVSVLSKSKDKLVLATLKTSMHPEIAKKFLEYAKSEEGQAIFNKYGLR